MNRPSFHFPEHPDREKLKEAGKSVLIAVLFISALLLLGGTDMLSSLHGAGRFGSDSPDAVSVEYDKSMEPFVIVVTPEHAAHYAVMNGDGVAEAYSELSAFLGEALGSSQEPVEVTQAEWERALGGGGIYFDFYSDHLISVLADWLGTSVSGGASMHTARRICLSADGDEVALYYIRARIGSVMRCDTALTWKAVSSRVAEFLPNEAKFNFELEEPFELVDRCAIFPAGVVTVSGVSASVPVRQTQDDKQLMSVFGMNSVLALQYSEPNGTSVWVEDEYSLRIQTDGAVTFSAPLPEEQGQPVSVVRAIDIAGSLCETAVGTSGGDAELYLAYTGQDPDSGEYTICFNYMIDGLPVTFRDGGYAARVTVLGTSIVTAELRLRTYALLESADTPLPPLLAGAAIQASGGGEPVLAYVDDYKSVGAEWIIR